ncbi:MAG: hypothetical protein ABFC34_08215 [Methanobacterium sp.]
MIEMDAGKRRNIFLSRFAAFVEKHIYDTNWALISASCDVSDILCKHERVIRSQYFGDPGYDICIFDFLLDVFKNDEQTGLLLINEIISNAKLTEEQEIELGKILTFFSSDNLGSLSITTDLLENNNKFIDVVNYPDDFYKKIVEEINFQYINKHSISLSILLRKLFENLIIDILRKKYKTAGLNVYYDTSKGRFHDFSILLKNLETKQQEFRYVSSNLDSKFIKELSKYRDVGNSSVHSIDVNINIEDITSKKEDINQKVQFLIRLLNNI